MFSVSDFSGIANVMFLHRRLNETKHCSVLGGAWFDLIVFLTLPADSYSTQFITTVLSKLSDMIKINLFWQFHSEFFSYVITML